MSPDPGRADGRCLAPEVLAMPRSPRRLRMVVVLASLLAALVGVVPAGNAAAFTTVRYGGAPGAPLIGVIGDSTVAAVRWYGTWGNLRSVNYTFDAESCRRTATYSCRGREGYVPDNALSAIRRLRGELGSVLVMVTGYDDPGSGFASAVDAIMAEAGAQGIPRVMWLTMRTADVTYVGPTFQSNKYTFADNNRILLQKAQQYGGRLQIADWATYSAQQPGWFASDGIHYSVSGSNAAAAFIASRATMVESGQTITPPPPPTIPTPPTPPPPTTPATWTNVGSGARGATVVRIQQAVMNSGIYLRGGSDGVYGPVTAAAVRQYQANRGLPATGVVDAATATAMGLWSGSTPPTTPPPATSGTYTVVRGDCLYCIARKTGTPINTLLSLNNLRLNSTIYPGQVLLTSTAVPAPAPPTTPPAGPGGTYTIVAGDYLYGIARKTGTPIDTLLSLNNLRLNSVIHSGQVLILSPPVPAATTLVAAAPPPADAAAAVDAPGSDPVTTVTTTTVIAAAADPASVPTSTVAPTTQVPVATSAIGDFVWDDRNGDGRQDVGEPGIENVTLRLLGSGGATLAETTSDRDGEYRFAQLPAGTYVVVVAVDDQHDITIVDQGDDDAVDSDVGQRVDDGTEVTARTVAITVDGSAGHLDVDIGLVAAVPATTPAPEPVTEQARDPETTPPPTTPPTPAATAPVQTVPPTTVVGATGATAPTEPVTTAPGG